MASLTLRGEQIGGGDLSIFRVSAGNSDLELSSGDTPRTAL
jgi:hypothetical protein